MTDATCAAIDTGMTAIEGWNFLWDGSKKCGYTTGSMASDKDQCLDACTGSNGFQPPKIISCYKAPVDGKCDTTGDDGTAIRRLGPL